MDRPEVITKQQLQNPPAEQSRADWQERATAKVPTPTASRAKRSMTPCFWTVRSILQLNSLSSNSTTATASDAPT